MVASMLMVTESPAGTTPFQVTVLVPVLAVAVPALELAATSVKSVESISVNSLPGLSCWSELLSFESTIR